jgi:epsilon-lactone hydrolase
MNTTDSWAQLNALLAASKSSQATREMSIAEMRLALDEQQSAYPVPDGVDFTPSNLGGVPVLTAAPATDSGNYGQRILYLHGGGYIVGSLAGYRSLTAHLALRTGVRVDNVGYRLAPEHPYPAAIDDALAAYRAMLVETEPGQIALAGDSAGAGLTLALLVAARDAGLPLPSGALLISPWIALDAEEEGSRLRNATRDPLMSFRGFSFMRNAYLGSEAKAPLLSSPLWADLNGLPPLMIIVGSAEMLLDDALALVRRAAEADLRVVLSVLPHMFHGFHSRSAVLAEADHAIDAAAQFLSERLERGISWECRT